jgi:hypothetical protein
MKHMTSQTGQSGNPAGRPRGVRGDPVTVIKLSADTDAATIVRAATNLIRSGDTAGAKACLRRWLSAGLSRLSARRAAAPRSLSRRLDALEAARSQGRDERAPCRALTLPDLCSHFVPMTVTTLGQAWKLGWRLRARCFWLAPGAKTSHGRKQIQCDTSAELDMKTLVWTRGEMFPLDQLESRLKCPRCGSRRVTVVFEIPNQPQAVRK